MSPDDAIDQSAMALKDNSSDPTVDGGTAAANRGALFIAGTLVNGRFRVVRELGSGGMGVVYEALDEKLERRVALKCAKPGHGDRLPPEVRAAREVSHFNVCKVHDLHLTATPFGDTEFLSMEFIDGETLSARIHREGPLREFEAREIARQICAGLAQAHRQGVIHGDLKCANVILTRSPEGGMRAVITDFGLAKMIVPGETHQTGSAGGTLDYMAPELLLGGHSTIASDLYSLGVLLHVMLTGEVPERHSAPRPASNPKQLKSDSIQSTKTLGPVIVDANWQIAIGKLPRPWTKVVAHCLAPRPENRYDSAEEAAEALQAPRRILKWFGAAAAAAALALGYWQWNSHAVPVPLRLAVMPFAVEGDPIQNAAGIGEDISDRLTGARRNFTIISPLEMQRANVDAAPKARTALGATHALETRLRHSGARIATEAWVTELGSGRTLGHLKGEFSSNDSQAISKAITATVTGALRLRAGIPVESVSAAAYSPYIQAIALLRQDASNAARAVPLFQKAIELDPRSALPYAGLAEARIQESINTNDRASLELAAASIERARAVNSDSVPVLLASGLFRQEHGQYEPAIHDFTRAAELEPNSPVPWKRLGSVYAASNRPDEAIAAYRRAIQADPNYHTTYLDFGNFYLIRNQFHEAEELYRHATTLAPNLASGQMNLGLALLRQSRFAEAEQSLLHALRLRRSARLLMNIGALYYAQEQYQKAIPFFEESVTAGPPSAIRFRDLGDVYRHVGRQADAAKAYRSARDLAQDEVNRNPRQAYSRALLALVCAFLGDTGRADSEAVQAVAIDPENAMVMREAAITYEVLRKRDETIRILGNAPGHLIEELSHDPDVKELQHDARFVALMQKHSTH